MTRVALVHDWLTGMRGGEKVLEDLCRMFPEAELFTLIHRKGSVSPLIERRPIHASALNRLPGIERTYRWFLPLLPRVIESFDLSGFELVISSSHCVALGCRPAESAFHLCYCHSPMRYVWDQFDAYFGEGRSSLLTRTVARLFRGRLQRWDVAAGRRVTRFAANSRFVAGRIERFYGRDASVVHPGVDTEFFGAARGARRDIALMVTALVPYKNVELALDAFRGLDLPLVVIGSGPRYAALRRHAGPNVTFLGWQTDELVRKYYSEARFLVFPGVEDFGMVPVEAMACGLPVLAYGEGGALETVSEPLSGLFFHEPTPESLADGVRRMLETPFDPHAVRRQALRFSKENFRQGIQRLLPQ